MGGGAAVGPRLAPGLYDDPGSGQWQNLDEETARQMPWVSLNTKLYTQFVLTLQISACRVLLVEVRCGADAPHVGSGGQMHSWTCPLACMSTRMLPTR